MSEEPELVQETEASTVGDVVAPQATAGELLRQAREAAGLHVAALAVSMKVPVEKLEALEADRLDQLPDAVFVRALASSVCRTLKIDPTPVLALLPQTTAPQLRPDEWGINAPFRAPGDATAMSLRDQISRPGVLAALAILAAALVLIFFPSMERKEVTSSEVVLATSTPANEATPAPGPTEKPADQPLPAPTAPALAPVEPPVASPVPPAIVVPPVVATPAPPAPVSAAVAAPQGGAPGNGVLGLKARGPSWVEVTDAQGVIQLRRTLATGETVNVSGALPLSVVIGRADVTEVQVRGKPFNLDTIVRENVARFEVK
ncbi:MAG: helix-turn-helix domain-containing protein [Hylemonella sp.]|nr:helix-turn-helix domain-containing protein [Hylemonella sp.]MDP1936647.1 helix-turn-helix domain-containing protein [Hylemonella sp.]